jgi:hypothetical protein
MRGIVLYAVLWLYVGCIPATAGERYQQWLLEPQGEGIIAFSFRSNSSEDKIATSELAFVCNQESKYVGVMLMPSQGTFKNQQDIIPVAIQKSENEFDSSGLLQSWEKRSRIYLFGNAGQAGGTCIVLIARENDRAKTVHFYFPNDLDARTPTTNHIVIDLSGFSAGLEAFKTQCEQ